MNILVIDDDREKYGNIFNVFEEDPANAYCFVEAPDNPGEEYLAGLVEIVKEGEISAILSLTYYQFISLACGVLQIPYLCWIVKGYEESSFDKTVTNPWNHIFCADYDTYEILKGADLAHPEYLPLAYCAFDTAGKEPKKDVLLIADDIEDFSSYSFKFDLLKDSTKGYLDAIIHLKKADLREKPFFENAAVYFREDLKNCYPLPEDDLEPEGHKYDHRLLYPLLDNKSPHIMLFHITASWVKKEYPVDVITKKDVTEKFKNEKIKYYTREEADKKSIAPADYKIIVYFPDYKEKDMVTEELLKLMASDSLVILPGYVHESVLNATGAVFYRNRYELAKVIDKYLYNEDERKEAVKKCNDYVAGLPSYSDQINAIIKNSLG